MAENKPTPWPPAPAAGEPEAIQTTSTRPINSGAGWFSVAALAIGIANTIFWLQDSLQRNAAKPWRPESVKITMDSMGMFFLPLWCIIAIASGILGRRSAPGRVGIIASLMVLLAAGVIALWERLRYGVEIW